MSLSLRLTLLSLTLAASACSGGNGSRADAGPDGGQTPTDGGMDDASTDDGAQPDGAPAEGGTDGSSADDGALPEGGTDDDGGMDDDGGTGEVSPTCPQPGTPCGAGDTCSGDGFVCITSACGPRICAFAGRPCFVAGDCHAQSACTDTICQPTNGEVCNDSRDCPAGFVCEGNPGARACTPRRVPCTELDCPVGYVCRAPTDGDAFFCVYVAFSCEDGKSCESECVDTNGDGRDECTHPPTMPIACAVSGESGCSAGLTCLDLFGEGQGQCVAEGGDCASAADCPAHALCGTEDTASPARCWEGF